MPFVPFVLGDLPPRDLTAAVELRDKFADWLAAELIGRGWSLKEIHTLIMTSAVYLQSSRFDDAKAAIIACYVAMEESLERAGTARAAADTPDELLARAAGSGLVRTGAAARLTALFYEARFSSHPMPLEQRDEAQRALAELADSLRDLEHAAAGTAGTAGDPPPRG